MKSCCTVLKFTTHTPANCKYLIVNFIVQIIDKKVEEIVQYFVKIIGRAVLQGGLFGGGDDGEARSAGGSSGGSGSSSRRVSITLPTFPPDADDDDDDDDNASVASSSSNSSSTTEAAAVNNIEYDDDKFSYQKIIRTQ